MVENGLKWEDPTPKRKYAHLLPKDTEIMTRYLRQWGKRLEAIAYDVHVGEGIDVGTEYPPEIVRMTSSISRMRLDALARQDGKYIIIEAKPSAGVTAIGQVLSYFYLIADSYPTIKPLKMLIVTDFLRPDVLKVCRHYKIWTAVV